MTRCLREDRGSIPRSSAKLIKLGAYMLTYNETIELLAKRRYQKLMSGSNELTLATECEMANTIFQVDSAFEDVNAMFDKLYNSADV